MKTTSSFTSLLFIGAVSLLPILSVDMPRMWSFLPGILALIYLIINKACYNISPQYDLKTLAMLFLILGLGFCSSLWAISAEETIVRSIKLSAVMSARLVTTVASNNAVQSTFLQRSD